MEIIHLPALATYVAGQLATYNSNAGKNFIPILASVTYICLYFPVK